MDDNELKRVRLSALKYITARSLTKVELRRKLTGKGFAVQDVEQVINEFQKARLLDDLDISNSVIENSLNLKLEGINQVKRRLYKRGIDAESSGELLREIYTDEAQYSAALKLARKKSLSLTGQPIFSVKNKIGGALERKGFPSSLIHRVLNQIENDTNDCTPYEE